MSCSPCEITSVRLQFLLVSFCMQRSRIKDGAEGKQTAEGKLAYGSEDDWYMGQGYVSRLWGKCLLPLGLACISCCRNWESVQ